MIDSTCQFCEMAEKYKPLKGSIFLCSRCVNRFIDMTQEQLKALQGYYIENRETLCVENFDLIDSKIKTLDMFIGEEHEQYRPEAKHRRNINRERVVRAIGNKAQRIGRSS